MNPQRTAVIGGGAAGLTAAITAAEQGDSVILYERMDRIGKKLLATGNGRCNLLNTTPRPYFGQGDFARRVFFLMGPDKQITFWHRHGLRVWEEEDGRVYPATFQAATVLDVLRFHLERLRVEVLTGAAADGLRRSDQGWHLSLAGQGEQGPFDRVIVTGGGKAQPKLGSDGSAYGLLLAQGHRLRTPKPALTALETDRQAIRGLSGLRVKANVTLMHGTRRGAKADGEVLFTDYGLSGICVMDCARDALPGNTLTLNLSAPLGYHARSEVLGELQRRRNIWRGEPASRILCGLVAPRLGERLAETAGVPLGGRRAEQLSKDELDALCGALQSWPLQITGKRGFDQAQVTAGGIDTDDFSPITLESTLAPGLHAAGEVLNVDGPCGGYNLMFAFGSGMLAGLNGRQALGRNQTSGK